MARRVAEEEDWEDDEDSEPDWPPDEDRELDEEELQALLSDDEGTIACPYCHEQIHEDSQRCPYCEQYLSDEDEETPTSRRPLWIIIGFVLCFIVAYFWVAP